MVFSKERILTISAGDYCKMSGRRLSEYAPVGVHLEEISNWGNPTERFVENVPLEAEVVVDYHLHRTLGEYSPADLGVNARGIQFTANGTALILKVKKKK